MAIRLRARSKFSGADVFKIVSRATGTIKAPFMPCRARAATSCHKLPDSPHSTELMMNMAVEEAKTVRTPNRSAAQPPTGRNAATASM